MKFSLEKTIIYQREEAEAHLKDGKIIKYDTILEREMYKLNIPYNCRERDHFCSWSANNKHTE